MKPFAIFNDIVTMCETQGLELSRHKANLCNMEPLYLYYKKATAKENGHLMLVADSDTAPSGYELATGEGLRCNVPYTSYWTWIRERSMRLPILAWDI